MNISNNRFIFIPEIERRLSLKFRSHDSLFCLHGHSSPDRSRKSESCKTSGCGGDVCFLQTLLEIRDSDQRGDCDRSLLSLFDLKQTKISINICFVYKIFKMYKILFAIFKIINYSNLLSKSFYLSRLLR